MTIAVTTSSPSDTPSEPYNSLVILLLPALSEQWSWERFCLLWDIDERNCNDPLLNTDETISRPIHKRAARQRAYQQDGHPACESPRQTSITSKLLFSCLGGWPNTEVVYERHKATGGVMSPGNRCVFTYSLSVCSLITCIPHQPSRCATHASQYRPFRTSLLTIRHPQSSLGWEIGKSSDAQSSKLIRVTHSQCIVYIPYHQHIQLLDVCNQPSCQYR